jgi:sugar lactone lactonase YvrE/4-amino-4-deoxy-L-arabinose transferase-like glycosyltransferase
MTGEPYNVYPATSAEAPAGRLGGTLAGPSAAPDQGTEPSAESVASISTSTPTKEIVLRIWRSRGLFGVLVAVAIGWAGEMALLTQNDFTTSTRNYVIAIALVIIALMHPAMPRLGRRNEALVSEEKPSVPAIPEPAAQVVPDSEPLTTLTVRKARASIGPESAGSAPVGTTTAELPTRPVRTREVATNGNGAGMVPYTGAIAAPAAVRATPVPSAAAVTGSKEKESAWARYKALRARLGWKMTVVGMAVVLALAGIAAWQFSQNSGSVLGGWLWVASLVALLVTFLGVEAWPRGEGLLPGPWDDWFAAGVPRIPVWVESALVLIVMGIAVYMRVWNLEYHPGIFGDEGERGIDARAIFEGQPDNIFGTGWWGVPNLYFYTVATSFRIFGDNLIGDRMVSVVSGLVAVWFIYKTGRLLWGPRAGLIAGLMLAVSPLAIQFSRLAGESSVTGALWAVGAYFVFMALRYRRWSDFLLAGFFWSINLYYYPSGKLIFLLIAGVLVYALVRWHIGFFKKYLLGFVLMGFAFVLTFMPYGIYSIHDNWQAFVGRAQETSIFSPQNQAPTFARYGLTYDPTMAGQPLVQSLKDHPAAWAGLIYQQAREGLDALYRRGDQVFYYREDRNNGIVLQPLWAVITLLGLAYALWKILDGRYGLALIWFVVGLSGTFLTIDVPNLQRYTGAWPAVMLFPAALIDRAFASGWPLSLRFAKKWSAIPIVALCIYLAVDAYQEYFVYYPTTCPYCTETTQARYLQGMGDDYKGYQMAVGGYDFYFGYGSGRFVAKGVEGEDMLAAADNLPVIDNNGKGLAFLIFPNNTEYLPLIRLFYPMGKEEVINDTTGKPVFTSIKVTREQLASTRTLHATYQGASGNAVRRDEAGIGTSQERVLPEGLTFPVQAEWKGGLVAPQYGTYRFSLAGTGDGKLELDGQTILEQTSGSGPGGEPLTVEMVLAKGIHDVRLTGSLADANAQLQVQWASGGTLLEPIDPLFLFNGPTGGLSGELGPLLGGAMNQQDPFTGQQVTQRRSDPFVGYREASVIFTNASYLALWRGKLNVPAEGDYGFGMGGGGQGAVTIDGTAVYGNGPAGAAGSGVVHLTAGAHDIDVRYASPAGPARIELLWTPPGGGPEIVPPTVLSPLRRSWTPAEVPNAPAASLPPTTRQSEARQPLLTFGSGDLSKPRGIAIDGSGNVYVGDRGNHRVVVYTPDGKVARTWGEAAPENSGGEAQAIKPGQFADINDVAVGDDGTVYVFDSNMRVQAFTGQGEPKGSIEPSSLNLYGPNGIGLANGGKGAGLYIAATGQNRLLHVPPLADVTSGKVRLPDALESITIGDGTEGADHLEQPVDVAVDPTGSGLIYAADLKDRIVQLTPPATVGGQWRISKQWSVPVGRADGGGRLAMTGDGKTLYMSDPDKSRVDVLNVTTGRMTFFGKPGGEAGEFAILTGMAVGADGKVYTVDSQSNMIQVFAAEAEKK